MSWSVKRYPMLLLAAVVATACLTMPIHGDRLVGGFNGKKNPSDREQKYIQTVVKMLEPMMKTELCGNGEQEDCGLELDEIIRIETQIVNGINYKVHVMLKSVDCCAEAMYSCRDLDFYVPLPVYCKTPTEDNPACIELKDSWDTCEMQAN